MITEYPTPAASPEPVVCTIGAKRAPLPLRIVRAFFRFGFGAVGYGWRLLWPRGDTAAEVPVTLNLFRSVDLNKAATAQMRYFFALGLFSLFINVLYLSSSIYMMQIYDRVIPGGRVETLILITLILVMALVTLSALEGVRGIMLVRMSVRLDALVMPRLIGAALDRSGGGSSEERAQAVRDFDTFRQFVTGVGATALLDAPWFPIYIGIILSLHPLLGAVAAGGIVVTALLAWFTELKTRLPTKKANQATVRTYTVADELVRNRETIVGLRMQVIVGRNWRRMRDDMLALGASSSEHTNLLGAGTKLFRLLMQSSMLGVGSYLVIQQELTAGAMIAASILLGRSMVPVEQAIMAWKQFVSVREAVDRVDRLLDAVPASARLMTLPMPTGALSVEKIMYAPSREAPLLLKGISFGLQPGECLSIIGPSAAGKTTLTRILVGALRPTAGVVRLDRADLTTWDDEQLRRTVGYLPQDIVLFQGTVRQNITRFEEARDEEVLQATQAANAHSLVASLASGYGTPVRDGGSHFSGGQRQRIGLARALFGDPMLVVLDEPNSHLDNEGEAALARSLQQLKKRKRTVIIVSHRPSTLALSDKILILRDGGVEMFGPATEVIAALRHVRENASAVSALPLEKGPARFVAQGE